MTDTNNERTTKKKCGNRNTYMMYGLSLGAGIGAALGAALGSVAIGVAIGPGIGMAIGMIMDQQKCKDSQDSN